MPKPTAGKDASEPSAQPAAAVSDANPPSHDDLGRLRDILFGSLQHEQEQTLARLEKRIAAQSAKLRSELDELVRRLEQRITELDERATRDHDDLREQMKLQQSLLSEAIEERGGQVTQLANEGLQQLRESKLDRGRFSAFLTGLAKQIEAGATAPEALREAKQPAPLPTRAQEPLRLRRAPWYPARPS